MIEAILQIPDEVLQANLKRENDVQDYGIIVVFLDNNFKISSIEKFENYEETKNSDKISQEQIKLLNCNKFQDPPTVDTQHKGFGGTRGLFTCSPIHIRLSRTYINKLLKNKKLKKLK